MGNGNGKNYQVDSNNKPANPEIKLQVKIADVDVSDFTQILHRLAFLELLSEPKKANCEKYQKLM